MKRAGNAVLAVAFMAAMTGGAKAQVNEVISYVNFNWLNISQQTCLDRGEDAINQALVAFGIEDATTRVSEWSVLANTSTLNFWVFCIADLDGLVDPAAERVLVVASVNSGRADIGGDLRDYLSDCMETACPSVGERIAWNQGANQFDGPAGTQFDLVCPALGNETMGTIWGTDIYTDDSPICVAAVHAGVIGTDGGAVVIEIMAGQKAYAASEQNGVASQSWGSYSRSYRFIDAVG